MCFCEISQPNFLPTIPSHPLKNQVSDRMKLGRMMAGWGLMWAKRSPAFIRVVIPSSWPQHSL